MRYANSKHSHAGICVESTHEGVLISSQSSEDLIVVHDKAQLEKLIELLRDASVKA